MTKQSIRMNPLYLSSGIVQKVTFETDPYNIVQGALRSIQKYCVILLTTLGTDKLRPTFGTKLSQLPSMNTTGTGVTLFVQDQIASAVAQFGAIQSADTTLNAVDRITSIETVDVSMSTDYKVRITLRFYPETTEAITLSINV